MVKLKEVIVKTVILLLNLLPWLLPIFVVVTPTGGGNHTFAWLQIYHANTAHDMFANTEANGTNVYLGLLGSCAVEQVNSTIESKANCTGASLTPEYDFSGLGDLLPYFLVFVPLGRTAILIISATAVNAFFCLLNVVDAFQFFDDSLRTMPAKVMRLFLGFVGVTLMVPAMLLTKASFDMMSDGFNNAIAKEAKYQNVNLYSAAGGGYSLVLGACISLCLNFAVLVVQIIAHDHPPA